MKSKYDMALFLLERDGWCQGSFMDIGGERCSVGAVRDAASQFQFSLNMEALRTILEVNADTRDIIDWNDRLGREFPEVREALLDAASIELSNPGSF